MSNATPAAPIPFASHLVALGWSELPARLTVEGGPKGGPAMVLRGKGSTSLDLRAVLPAGARVTVGAESGVIEYSPRSHYVRLDASQDFDSPVALVRTLLDLDATIAPAVAK